LRATPTPALFPYTTLFRSDYGTRRVTGVVGGSTDAVFYQANVGHTLADNFRLYSRQELTNAYARVGTTLGGTDFVLQGLGLDMRSEEHTSELQSRENLVCR